MIAPDDTTFAFLEGRDHAPTGAAWEQGPRLLALPPHRPRCHLRQGGDLDATELAPFVTWGTNPAQVTRIDGTVPHPDDFAAPAEREAAARALEYMGLVGGTPGRRRGGHRLHRFVAPTAGSRTYGRRRRAARTVGLAGHAGPRRPGSHRVKAQAESEGLHQVFHLGRLRVAGAGLLDVPRHEPGQVGAGGTGGIDLETATSRAARAGGPHHLVSPAVAAATAVAGHFATPGS